MIKIATRHRLYLKKIFSWIQVEDCMEGSDAVKSKNELYLPMPAGFEVFDTPPDAVRTSQMTRVGMDSLDGEAPFHHSNKSYQSYLQRARFPDHVNSVMTGFLGLISSEAPEVVIPSAIKYLEVQATIDGLDLEALYSDIVCKVLATGKVSLLVDVRSDGTIYFVAYDAKSNINWNVDFKDGKQILQRAVFQESIIEEDGTESQGFKEYIMAPLKDEEGREDTESGRSFYQVNTYNEDGELTETVVPYLHGSLMEEIPLINIGSVKNTIDPDTIPLLGLSDISLTIYRENADLHQSHFMTCNPTLFLFGVDPDEIPTAVGSTAAIGISDSSARAEYPSTDTSALDHIRVYLNDLKEEAVQQSVKFLGDRKGSESGEALRRRENAQSTDLVHIATLAGKGIEDALNMGLKWLGVAEKAEFTPSVEFGRIVLTSGDVDALVRTWLQGGISQDTMMDRLREGGIIAEDIDNEGERQRIDLSAPSLTSKAKEGEGDERKLRGVNSGS